LALNTIIGLTAYNLQDITDYKDLMIDILICNFTPPDHSNFNIGNVDLGGPTLVRASILKPDLPYILTDPDQYKHFPDIFSTSEKEIKDFKKQLAIMALKKCQEYDKMLLEHFQSSMVSSI
jgi:AICAR transformylase/IMP cyclohydrolase PurH